MWTQLIKYGIHSIPAVIATIAVAVLVAWIYVIPNAKKDGRNEYVAQQAVADIKNEARSKGTMVELQGKSDYDLCVSALKRKRMPIDSCQQLLGVPAE